MDPFEPKFWELLDELQSQPSDINPIITPTDVKPMDLEVHQKTRKRKRKKANQTPSKKIKTFPPSNLSTSVLKYLFSSSFSLSLDKILSFNIRPKIKKETKSSQNIFFSRYKILYCKPRTHSRQLHFGFEKNRIFLSTSFFF